MQTFLLPITEHDGVVPLPIVAPELFVVITAAIPRFVSCVSVYVPVHVMVDVPPLSITTVLGGLTPVGFAVAATVGVAFCRVTVALVLFQY